MVKKREIATEDYATNCMSCKNQLLIKKGRRIQKFCNRKCLWDDAKKLKKNVSVVCKTCSLEKTFLLWPNDIPTTYCSAKCERADKSKEDYNPFLDIVCITCKKERTYTKSFHVYYQGRFPRFCGRPCAIEQFYSKRTERLNKMGVSVKRLIDVTDKRLIDVKKLAKEKCRPDNVNISIDLIVDHIKNSLEDHICRKINFIHWVYVTNFFLLWISHGLLFFRNKN